MVPTAGRLSRFHARNVQYFTQYQGQIARANLRQLLAASAAFSVFLLGYGILTGFLFQNIILTMCYLLFGGVALLFLGCSLLWRRREPSPRTVQAAVMLFILAVVGFTVAVSVFPFPERPGIFYPLAYMLVLVVFILPYRRLSALLTLATAGYLLLVVRFKSPLALSYDAFAGVTTWALGFFILYVVTDLRLRDGARLQALEKLSRTDPLTGLPNRLYLEDHLDVSYRRCRQRRLWCAMVMLDVDDFKSYNDRMGHQAGDVCLRALGGVLLRFSEEQGVYAARYGGEEFLLFLPDCSEEDARWAGGELLSRIRALALPFPGQGRVTVSLGIAVELPRPDGDWRALLHQADGALYRSKAEGKDRMELWI